MDHLFFNNISSTFCVRQTAFSVKYPLQPQSLADMVQEEKLFKINTFEINTY